MPVVRTYDALKVQPIALPGVRLTAAETPESEGAGVEEARAQKDQALAGFAGAGAKTAFDLYQQATDNADNTAILDASNQLKEWVNTRLYDPQTGALAVKGKDAMGLPEDVGDQYQQQADQIAGSLTTKRQRDAFARIRSQEQNDLDLTLHRHVYQEMQAYAQGETDAALKNSVSAAVSNSMDPDRVGIERDNAMAAIDATATQLGLGPEQIAERKAAAKNAIYTGVIDQLLSADNPSAARAYFDEAKAAGELTGQGLTAVQKAIEAGEVRKQAQVQSDKIIAEGGSLSDQLTKAKAIDDPELRDAVSERIEHQNALNEAALRQQNEQALTGAYNVVDQTHDITKIPPQVWGSLPGSARSALREYANRLVEGTPVKTDWPTFYSLVDEAGKNEAAFAQRNLLTFRGALGDAEFKQLADLQLSIRNKDGKAAEILAGTRTNEQLVNDALTLYGMDPNAKQGTPQAAANAELRRMFDQGVSDAEARKGSKITDQDKSDILDGILTTTTGKPGSWWGLAKLPTLFFNPFGMPDFFGSTKRVTDLTVADIPAAKRPQIEQALRDRGRPVNDQTVLALYQDTLVRLQQAAGGSR